MPSFGCLEHKLRPRSFEQESRDTYLHLELIDKNKRSLVSALKESCDNFRSPLMKSLDGNVETLRLES